MLLGILYLWLNNFLNNSSVQCVLSKRYLLKTIKYNEILICNIKNEEFNFFKLEQNNSAKTTPRPLLANILVLLMLYLVETLYATKNILKYLLIRIERANDVTSGVNWSQQLSFCSNYSSHGALPSATAFESYLLPEIRLMLPLFYLS